MVKEYKLKKKDYMIYNVKDNMIYGLFVDAYIRETDLKPTINSYIEYKPLWIDNLLWDILDMESNKNESDSLRVTGAFTVRGMTYSDDTIEFDGNMDTLEKLIDDLFKKFENTISKLTNEKYILNLKNNSIAKKVKLANLIHNYDTSRLEHMTQKDIIRNKKYDNEIKMLSE